MDDHLKARLKELKNQLLFSGYHSFQIDDMIRDAIGSARLDTLDMAQGQHLIETLEEHLKFAAKCRAQRGGK